MSAPEYRVEWRLLPHEVRLIEASEKTVAYACNGDGRHPDGLGSYDPRQWLSDRDSLLIVKADR